MNQENIFVLHTAHSSYLFTQARFAGFYYRAFVGKRE